MQAPMQEHPVHTPAFAQSIAHSGSLPDRFPVRFPHKSARDVFLLKVLPAFHPVHEALLDKPERRLVLQIIDAKDQIAEDRSIDSFIAGFRLAWRLSNELNMYEKTRPMLTPKAVAGMDAFIDDEN